MKTGMTVIGVFVLLACVGGAVVWSAGGRPVEAGEGVDGGDASAVIEVTDDRGRVFRFDQPPERIAACSAFALEALMAMDLPPVLRFDATDLYPPEAESIPVVSRSHSVGPDVEQLIAHDPDLIVLHQVFGSFADAVEQAVGVPVMVMNIKSVDEVREKLGLFGDLTGNTGAADALVEDLQRTQAWLADNTSADNKPVALSLLGSEDTWYAHRENHFMGSLLKAAGAANAAADDPAHAKYRSLTPIDLEQVIIKDPDVIFLIPYGDADRAAVVSRFTQHPATQSLRAVRNKRVHVLPDTIYTRQPGPRTGQALRELYTHLYPERAAPNW